MKLSVCSQAFRIRFLPCLRGSHIGFSPLSLIVFLYFFTLHADQLHVPISLFYVRANNFLAVLLLLFVLAQSRIRHLRMDKSVLRAFGILMVSVIVSTCLSPYAFRSSAYALMYLFTLACYFVLPYWLVLLYRPAFVFKLYFASFLAVGGVGLLQHVLTFAGIEAPFLDQKIFGIARAHALAYEPSYYALYMIPFVAVLMGFRALKCNLAWGRLQPVGLLQLLAVNLLLVISLSTSVFYFYLFLAGVMRLGAYLTRQPSIRQPLRVFSLRYICALASLTALGALALYDLFEQTFLKFFIMGVSHGSFADRWDGIVNAWKVFCMHPIFGVGIGGVGPFVFDHCVTSSHMAEVLDVHGKVDMKMFDPTNVMVEILASLGLFGLACVLYLIATWHAIFRKVMSSAVVCLNGKKVTLALWMSAVVMIFCLQFNGTLFRTYVWTHIALSFAYMTHLLEHAKQMQSDEKDWPQLQPAVI